MNQATQVDIFSMVLIPLSCCSICWQYKSDLLERNLICSLLLSLFSIIFLILCSRNSSQIKYQQMKICALLCFWERIVFYMHYLSKIYR